MKREVRGTQRSRYIVKIDEEASAVQRSDSFVQSMNQRFLKQKPEKLLILLP